MKKISVLLLGLMLSFGWAFAGGNDADPAGEEINWLSFEEAEQKMKEQPRKVIIDVYTGWCGWCKVMDKKTYANPDVIKYINQNFYAIKFNAEEKKVIHFLGKDWEYNKQYRANDLAINMLQGKMSYPTTIVTDKNFQNPNPIPGYLEVKVMEPILKYFGEKAYMKQSWEDYQKSFKPEWASGN